MRVTPVSPVARTGNDTRPAREHIEPFPCDGQAEPAKPLQSRASIILELYGAPLTFGLFPSYGDFSAKV